MSNFIYFLSILSVVCANRVTYRRNVLFTLKPGKATCFVKTVDRFGIIKVEYQIIEKSGGVSNHTVSFDIQTPRAGAGAARGGGGAGRPRWPAAALALHAPESGQYRFCFDNTFDRQKKKTILFKLSVHAINKTLRNDKERKHNRRYIESPGIKTMILDPIVPVPVDGNGPPQVTLAELLKHKNDNIFTWKEKKYKNMMRLTDYSNKLPTEENKALLETIRHDINLPKVMVAPESSLLEHSDINPYHQYHETEDPDDPDDSDDPDDRHDISNPYAAETITGSQSWLPYRWDMIDYA